MMGFDMVDVRGELEPAGGEADHTERIARQAFRPVPGDWMPPALHHVPPADVGIRPWQRRRRPMVPAVAAADERATARRQAIPQGSDVLWHTTEHRATAPCNLDTIRRRRDAAPSGCAPPARGPLQTL
jgi:hypothetical protein